MIFCVFVFSCWGRLEQEFAKGVLERGGGGSSSAKWLTALLHGLFWHSLRTAYVWLALRGVNTILLHMATESNKSFEFVRFGVRYIPDAVNVACVKLLQVLGMRTCPCLCDFFHVFLVLILILQFDICRSFVSWFHIGTLIFVVCSTYSLSPFFIWCAITEKPQYSAMSLSMLSLVTVTKYRKEYLPLLKKLIMAILEWGKRRNSDAIASQARKALQDVTSAIAAGGPGFFTKMPGAAHTA